MSTAAETKIPRKQIAVRFLFSILYLFILEIVKVLIQLTTIFQYLYLFINQSYSEPARTFANRTAVYGYRVMRYLTLNDNNRPFPFQEFPEELELPEEEVNF